MRETRCGGRPLFFLLTLLVLSLFACDKKSAGFEELHQCDEYAAHPEDPGRWSDGVPEEEILPGPAVRFCQQAVDEHPDTARFHFQLGRALWAAGKIEEGVEQFKVAQKMKYAPAYAYLADAYQEGLVPGEEADPERAQELYAEAAEAGFQPAAEVLGGGGPDGEPSGGGGGSVSGGFDGQGMGRAAKASTASLRLENPSFFKQPDWLVALHGRDFTTLMQAEGVNLYLEGIQQFMMPENYRMVDATCSAVADARLGPKIAAIRLGVGLDSSSEEMMLQGGNLLLRNILSMQKDPAQYMRWQAEMSYLMSDGERDMSTLVQTYGCTSSEVRTLYNNIGPFIDFARKPQPSQSAQQKLAGTGEIPPNAESIDLKRDYQEYRDRAAAPARTESRARVQTSSETSDGAPRRRASSRRGVTLFAGEHYGGASEKLSGDDPDLSDNSVGDDSVSSVRVDPGCEAVLFSRSGYRGRHRTVTSDTPDLRMNWKKKIREIHRAGDDSVSSIKVHCG